MDMHRYTPIKMLNSKTDLSNDLGDGGRCFLPITFNTFNHHQGIPECEANHTSSEWSLTQINKLVMCHGPATHVLLSHQASGLQQPSDAQASSLPKRIGAKKDGVAAARMRSIIPA